MHDPKSAVGSGNTHNTRIFRVGHEVHFSDDVTYSTMHDLVKILKEAEQKALENVTKCKKNHELTDDENENVELTIKPKPIKLFITSHGGAIYAALQVVDVIHSLKVDVHTIVVGYVASAGTLISMAGARRFITAHSFMLIHQLTSSFWGKHSEFRDEIENLDKIMTLLTEYYKKHTKIDESALKETLSRDRNWGLDECIKNGLVDEIYK